MVPRIQRCAPIVANEEVLSRLQDDSTGHGRGAPVQGRRSLINREDVACDLHHVAWHCNDAFDGSSVRLARVFVDDDIATLQPIRPVQLLDIHVLAWRYRRLHSAAGHLKPLKASNRRLGATIANEHQRHDGELFPHWIKRQPPSCAQPPRYSPHVPVSITNPGRDDRVARLG